MAMGPNSVTQSNLTHHFFNPTHQNPKISDPTHSHVCSKLCVLILQMGRTIFIGLEKYFHFRTANSAAVKNSLETEESGGKCRLVESIAA
jgi:hypothetical protein